VERLGQRRYPSEGGYTSAQAHELAALSRELSRQIGLILDRTGRVQMIIVGTPTNLFIPELPTARSVRGLRGVRLLHTHLKLDGISQEDLMDMLFLRLDALSVLTVNPQGEPVTCQNAHLLPVLNDETPYLVEPATPWDAVKYDFGEQAEALDVEFDRIIAQTTAISGAERAVLVSVASTSREAQESRLDELESLARSAGIDVVGRLVQKVKSVHPRHLLGKGKLSELEILCLQKQASLAIFDGELTPAQLGHLVGIIERKVLDRTQLILDIFASRATSRAGKWQVEMAQLVYTQPRLVGRHSAMDRLMGGVGGRGPGETKLETDRRRIKDRIAKIKKELDTLRSQRAFARSRRVRQDIPVAALVGYTNAGKSSLLNALTGAKVYVEDALFATLDPTTRRLRLPQEQELVLADTVGFIRNLPKELTEAFQATLEELHSADVLLHVIDASHADWGQQKSAVEEILGKMGLHEIPVILIFNKWDCVEDEAKDYIKNLYPHAQYVSATTKFGLRDLSEFLRVTLLPDSENEPYRLLASDAEVSGAEGYDVESSDAEGHDAEEYGISEYNADEAIEVEVETKLPQ